MSYTIHRTLCSWQGLHISVSRRVGRVVQQRVEAERIHFRLRQKRVLGGEAARSRFIPRHRTATRSLAGQQSPLHYTAGTVSMVELCSERSTTWIRFHW